jgi:hypothetical protein
VCLNSTAIFLQAKLVKSDLEQLFNLKFHKQGLVSVNEIMDDMSSGVPLSMSSRAIRRRSGDTTPIDVAVVPVCTCFVASVRFLCVFAIHVAFVSSIASRQCALCLIATGNKRGGGSHCIAPEVAISQNLRSLFTTHLHNSVVRPEHVYI